MNLLYIFYVLNKHKGILCAFAEEINLLMKKKKLWKGILVKKKKAKVATTWPQYHSLCYSLCLRNYMWVTVLFLSVSCHTNYSLTESWYLTKNHYKNIITTSASLIWKSNMFLHKWKWVRKICQSTVSQMYNKTVN